MIDQTKAAAALCSWADTDEKLRALSRLTGLSASKLGQIARGESALTELIAAQIGDLSTAVDRAVALDAVLQDPAASPVIAIYE